MHWFRIRSSAYRRKYQALTTQEDFVFVTWDSCRYDAYQQAHTPVLDTFCTARRAWAMATYTAPAHAAMFQGFLPHVFSSEPFYNRYCQQLWRISHRNVHVKPLVTFPAGTQSIVNGFRRRGYFTAGMAAMYWFKDAPELQTGFQRFKVTGTAARQQTEELLGWLTKEAQDRPCFAFINYGETHSPFVYEGMAQETGEIDSRWSLSRQLNQQGELHSSWHFDEEAFARQVACAEYLDTQMQSLLTFFQQRGRPTTVVVCGDHGECFGENGLYGHAFYHEKVMEVPLLIFRLNAPSHTAPQASAFAHQI